MSATPKQIAAAANYLREENIRGVSPRHLAASSSELGKSFKDTLEYLAHLLSGGQGQGPAPGATKKVKRLKPDNAIGGAPIEYAEGV